MRSGHLHNAKIQVKKYVFLNVFFNIFLKTRFKHVYKKKVILNHESDQNWPHVKFVEKLSVLISVGEPESF